MSMLSSEVTEQLINSGVTIHHPVMIDPAIDPERIAPGVEIFPGCRLAGAATSIGPGCRIGHEGPAVLINCQLGDDVCFASGFAEESVFLAGASIGANAHIRPGTVIEEQASCAHCVGLKQTVLMPWVTLGSLVNFCDCLMAGGTGPKDHGEVGSSFVHFNFTPRGDKATASLIGDVPHGVLLDQPTIFLGGQGGLAGPVRIAYGTVTAAGTIVRQDVTEPALLIRPAQSDEYPERMAYKRHHYGRIDRIVGHTLGYVGNIHALAAWYRHVRLPFAQDPFTTACYEGVQRQFEGIAKARCHQLMRVAATVREQASQGVEHQRLLALEPHLPEILHLPESSPAPSAALVGALNNQEESHIARIQALNKHAREAAVEWLQSIVDRVRNQWEGDNA